MNPTPDQVASIRSFVAGMGGGWANTDDQIRQAMSDDLVPNPLPQSRVPTPFDATTVFGSGKLSPASVSKLITLPSFDSQVIPMLNLPVKQPADIENLLTWAAAYFTGGALSQAEFDYLASPIPGTTAGATTGLFNLTEGDPNWQPQVPWDVANLGRPVDAYDIMAARAGQ